MKRYIFLFLVLLFTNALSAQLVMQEAPVELNTATGTIKGTLKVPHQSKDMPVVLIIQGSGPTNRDGNTPFMKNNSLKMLSDALFYKGYATLCFDKRGIAESKDAMKNEAELRFDDYVNDVKGWIDLLSKDKRFSSIIVLGHSEGSLIAMLASQNNKRISKFISLAGVGQKASEILRDQLNDLPQDIKNQAFSILDKLEKGEEVKVVSPSFQALFRESVQPYLISWFKYNPQEEIAKLNIPVLLISGTMDIQVPPIQTELLAKANSNAQKVIIEKMTHVLKDSKTLDKQEQMKTVYTKPDIPLNDHLISEIVNFIR